MVPGGQPPLARLRGQVVLITSETHRFEPPERLPVAKAQAIDWPWPVVAVSSE